MAMHCALVTTIVLYSRFHYLITSEWSNLAASLPTKVELQNVLFKSSVKDQQKRLKSNETKVLFMTL